MVDALPIITPMEAGHRLLKSMSPTTPEEKKAMSNLPYRQVVGSIRYLVTCTRPDIAFSASQISQHMNNPGDAHWTAAKRLLRYLKFSKSVGIYYQSQDDLNLTGWADSDYAGDSEDRRSTSGHIFLFAGGPICWYSKKQDVVALSSSEAEYISLSAAATECISLQQLFKDMLFPIKIPTTLFCDNQASISICNSESISDRLKHISIKHHFIKDLVANNQIQIQHVPSKEMFADFLTKSLPKSAHWYLCKGAGITSPG